MKESIVSASPADSKKKNSASPAVRQDDSRVEISRVPTNSTVTTKYVDSRF